MSIYSVKLKRKEVVAEGTMAFYFEKPAGFQFTPGQFADFTLINPPETDAEGNIRTFSIASAPHEEDLMIATRIRDTAFKRVLKSMPLGAAITVDGPQGSFALRASSPRPSILLAGGVGITPFRSMALDASTSRHAHRLLLLYSNRRPEDAAFLHELEDLAAKNKNFALVATMTEMQKSKQTWSGHTGVIDKAMLAQFGANVTAPLCFVAGPPAMVDGLKKTLTSAGIKEEDIRAEDFSGY
jgi:ferredoxin-NADP reductase